MKLFWIQRAAIILGFTITTLAQQGSAPPADDAMDILQVQSSIVNMIFTVRDGEGRLVKNLGRDQFRVTDEGLLQTVSHFAEEANQPLSLAVLLDKSTSVSSQFDFEKRATADFVRSVVRPGKDQALMITFDREPRLAVEVTDDSEDVVRAIEGLRAEGGTALFDAARLAIERYLSGVGPERRVLVLVTDGDDTVSWTTHSEVLSLALSNNVVVYTLGVKPEGPGNYREARRNLERLSGDTGGLALFPTDNPRELAGLFGRVEDELRHQYSLGYALPPPDGKAFRNVEIQPAQKAHRVRTRRGYYTAAAARPR